MPRYLLQLFVGGYGTQTFGGVSGFPNLPSVWRGTGGLGVSNKNSCLVAAWNIIDNIISSVIHRPGFWGGAEKHEILCGSPYLRPKKISSGMHTHPPSQGQGGPCAPGTASYWNAFLLTMIVPPFPLGLRIRAIGFWKYYWIKHYPCLTQRGKPTKTSTKCFLYQVSLSVQLLM